MANGPKSPDFQTGSLGVLHTPDFFVLRADGAGWEEWKAEDDLLRLAKRMPGRYIQEDGQWRCPPGEAWATPLGLFYRLRSAKEINWVSQRNLQVLEDFFAEDRPLVPPEMAEAVQTLVSSEPTPTPALPAPQARGPGPP